jgi:DNA-binding transcriptional ArsR family regulator
LVHFVATEKYGKIAQGLKALGHPVRISIVLQLLRQDECTGGEISGKLPVAASTVSQHLNTLLAADLIKMRIDGPRRYYRLNQRALEYLQGWLGKL